MASWRQLRDGSTGPCISATPLQSLITESGKALRYLSGNKSTPYLVASGSSMTASSEM